MADSMNVRMSHYLRAIILLSHRNGSFASGLKSQVGIPFHFLFAMPNNLMVMIQPLIWHYYILLFG